jgi:hypothetical protein
MPARLPLALMFFLVFITSACSAPMKKIEIKKNPHPAMRYDITMTINDAPGRFDEMVVFATYQVMNDACVPLQPGSGARLNPMTEQVLPLTRVNEHVYTASMYVDQFQDEDYYGLGVCHWTSTGVDTNLRIGNVTVSPSLSLDEVLKQKSINRYFSKKLAFTDQKMHLVDTGNPHRSDFKEDADNTFSVTLTAKEHFP